MPVSMYILWVLFLWGTLLRMGKLTMCYFRVFQFTKKEGEEMCCPLSLQAK